MVIPNWLSQAILALSTSHARNRGEFILDDEPITLEFLDTSQVAVVKSHHRGRNFVPGGVVWVKKVAQDGVTLLEVQYFGEGALGALRGFTLVHTVEGAKVEALDGVTNQLPKNLTAYLLNGSGGELPWALSVHLAVLDSFSETPKDDFAFTRLQIRRMCSVFDRTGRSNRHSRVMGVESSIQRIIKVSKKRQRTKGAAALAAATLGEVLKNYEAFLVNVKMFLESKLNANTWSVNTERNRKWLKDFAIKLSTWAVEFQKIDMQPFAMDAHMASDELTEASEEINEALRERKEGGLADARANLTHALDNIDSMLLRFETARALRVVSLAADDRVRKFGIEVTEPNWLEMASIARRAMEKWGVTDQAIIDNIATRNADRAYTAFREIVRAYDNASRAAAA